MRTHQDKDHGKAQSVQLGIVNFQETHFTNLLEQLLVLDKVLTIFAPVFRELLELLAREVRALMAVGDPFFLATQMERGAALTTGHVDASARARLPVSCVGRATTTKHTASRNSIGIGLHFSTPI
jgi:hypothetical protein